MTTMPPNKNHHLVTIVIPTYGRPDALACAIKSVLLQTLSNWRLIVVGDACNLETGAAMVPFLSDPRIRYINIPWRCGEQALLNSAVMHIAETKFIAFLNHDDIWLPNHLEISISRLQQSEADFFMARTAWVWTNENGLDNMPLFESVSPYPRNFTQAFLSGFHYIEPASSWVITNALAKKVGPWKRAEEIFRAPIQDWVLRAWRNGAQLAEENIVTCVKFENHWAEAHKIKYETLATSQQRLLNVLNDPNQFPALEKLLKFLCKDHEAIGKKMQLNLGGTRALLRRPISALLLTPIMAKRYFLTGRDSFTTFNRLIGTKKGEWMRKIITARTGEGNTSPPSLESIINFLNEELNQSPQ